MNGAVFADNFGINFTAGGTLNIENTVISSFGFAGVWDTASGSNLWVYNCDVKKGIDGIFVQGTGTFAVIENSRAVENSGYGIYAYSGSTVAIRNSVAAGNGTGFRAQASFGTSTELVVDSCMSTNNGKGLWSWQIGIGVANLRAGQNIVMNNGTNLSTTGGSGLISQGGNRIGGATGGTTGFTSTVPQQ
jgi:hypothetical protein